MKLAESSWNEVEALDRNAVVLIPTGSLEQHGRHLPLFTDSILATAVADEVERRMADKVLLTPTLWLGASGHHLAFAGTLSASFAVYIGAIQDVVESLLRHRFTKFFLVNGHGGNSEPNGIAMRELRARHPSCIFGHSNYYSFAEETAADVLTGPAKRIQHACEAETSLIMHLRQDLVRTGRLRDDGLVPDPPVTGMIHHFDEITEEGSKGFATMATAEKGKVIFEASVAGLVQNLDALSSGYVFKSE